MKTVKMLIVIFIIAFVKLRKIMKKPMNEQEYHQKLKELRLEKENEFNEMKSESEKKKN